METLAKMFCSIKVSATRSNGSDLEYAYNQNQVKIIANRIVTHYFQKNKSYEVCRYFDKYADNFLVSKE